MVNPLTRLKSTLSTVTSTLQAVRELPGAMKEAIAFARENSEVRRELEAANKQLDKGLNLHQEWMEKCIDLTAELEIASIRCQQKLDLQWDAVKAMEKERDAANGEWDSIAREREDLRTKLARHEAAETWHQVTAGEGELPPPIPVLWRNNHPDFPVGELNYCIQGACGCYEWRFLSSNDVPETAGNNG